jgi:hypothetical protein
MVKKVYEWSSALTRSLGRPKNRWEDDVKSDKTRMKITNWKDCIKNQIKWKLHLVGCNLELYYDARTYGYQIYKNHIC